MPALDYYKRRCARLETALAQLVEACEKDAGVPGPDDEDDETVGWSQASDKTGKPVPMALTFGMMRRARAALD